MIHAALYTRPQRDRSTAAALCDMGIEAHAPIALEPGRSRGKRRQPEMHERVLLPRIVFARLTPAQYHRVQVHRLWRDVLARLDIPSREWRSVKRFVRDAEDEVAQVRARIAAGEVIQHYRPGDELRVISGPLGGQVVRFVESMAGADDLTVRIRARVEAFGGWVPVEVDPLDVTRADT